jgi:hypothetical protein
MNNKRVLSVVIALGLVMSGCSSTATSNNKPVETVKSQSTNQQGNEITDNKPVESSSNQTNNNKPAETVEIGKTITSNNYCDFTIQKVDFNTVAKPSKAEQAGYVSYRTKSSNTMYLDVTVKLKNLLAVNMQPDILASIEAIDNDEYTIKSFTTLENDEGTDFIDASKGIDPSKTGTVRYLFEVPKSLQNHKGSLVLRITINNVKYSFNLK